MTESNLKQNYAEINRFLNTLISIDELEYIYIDQKILADNQKYLKLLDDKIFLTTNEENICMFDYTNYLKGEYDKMEYTPKVDLIIISNTYTDRDENVERMMDNHTIISKILSSDVFYIEDSFRDIHIFITKENTYIFKGTGLKTQLINPDEYNT